MYIRTVENGYKKKEDYLHRPSSKMFNNKK